MMRSAHVIPKTMSRSRRKQQAVAALLPPGRTSPTCVDAGGYLPARYSPSSTASRAAPDASCATPMCMYLRSTAIADDALAIQRGQSPADGPIFTPLDDPVRPVAYGRRRKSSTPTPSPASVFHLLRTTW